MLIKLARYISFSDGKLKLLFPDERVVIRAWGPKAGAWRLSNGSAKWDYITPNLHLRRMYLNMKRTSEGFQVSDAADIVPSGKIWAPSTRACRISAYNSFLDSIPKRALRVVKAYPDQHWILLQALNRTGLTGFELAQDNPMLFYVIASHNCFGQFDKKRNQHYNRLLCCMKRKAALARLDFPDTEWAVRCLKKIVTKSISIRNAFGLRSILNSGDKRVVKYLCHLDNINAGVIAVLRPRTIDHITFDLLESVAKSNEYKKTTTAYQIKSIISMYEFLNPNKKFRGRFKHIEQVWSLYNDLADEMWQKRLTPADAHILTLKFPQPDLPLIKNHLLAIDHIKTPEELINHGKKHRNCVALFAHQIAHGELYMFAVAMHDPESHHCETATLALNHSSNGKWVVEDLLGPGNSRVSDQLRSRVNNWLTTVDIGCIEENNKLADCGLY